MRLPSLPITTKVYVVISLLIAIPFLVFGYINAQNTKKLVYSDKEHTLVLIMSMLEQRLPKSYFEILKEEGALSLNSEEQRAILNKRLQPIVDEVATAFPDYVLFYADYDNIIAVPSRFSNAKVTLGKRVYNEGKMLITVNTHSTAWGTSSLALNYPLTDNGKIYGHIGVSTKTSDVEYAYRNAWWRNLAILFILWISVVYILYRAFSVINKRLDELSTQIKEKNDSKYRLQDFPQLEPVLDTVIDLRIELNEKHNEIEQLLESINDMFYSVDSNMNIIYANLAAKRWLGYNIVGMNIWSLCGGKISPFFEQFETVRNTQKSMTLEAYGPVRGKWVEITVYPAQNDGLSVLFRDISEKKEMQKQTEENLLLYKNISLRLNQLIEICPMPILELDKDGFVVRLNSAMYNFYKEYLPYEVHELIGKNIRDLSAELKIYYEQSFIAQVMNGNEIRNQHIVSLDKHWIVNGMPMYSLETGEFTGAIAYYHDITQYENFKNEMARLEFLNAIGETASSVAHELRNPATTVRGFVQMLSMKAKDDQKGHYDIILEELDRMNEIIDDFLSLARNRFIPKSKHNLNDILNSIYPLLHADSLKNDVELKLNLCDEECILELNAKEVKQLVLNLARNGIESMKPKGILTIFTRKVANGIELIINDTGEGISSDILPNIFKPFYTSKKNGTGLGLSVSQNIAEGHNGRITVESQVGKGTSFNIFFPFSDN